MKILQECTPIYLSQNTKIIVNGNWIGVIADPIEVVQLLKVLRRNGVLPTYMSISFDYGKNEVKKALRSVIWIKYKIKDKEVFDKAYSYIEQYY